MVIVSYKDYLLDNLKIESLYLRPRCLILGIGCNRNTTLQEIETAVFQLVSEHRLSLLSIASLATIEDKRDEKGLLTFGKKHGIPIQFFSKHRLNKITSSTGKSAWAQKALGVKGVAEPAARLLSKKIIIPKQKMNPVTLAVGIKAN